MGITVRRLVLLLPMLVASATACSNATNGSPVPTGNEPTTGTTTEQTQPSSSAKPSSGDSPLAKTDPCSLVTANAKAQLDISGNGTKSNLGGGRICEWEQRRPSETYIFGVGIHDRAGIKDLSSDLVINQLPDIGSHKAVQNPAKQGGACSVIMGVTESSRVTATVVAGVDVQKGCDLALQMAKLVEPELPQG